VEIIHPRGRIEHLKLGPRAPLHLVRQLPNRMASEQSRRTLVGKTLDHGN